jgi:hypothetical protein
MGQYTTYKCDKCGKEWLSTTNTEQPVSLAIILDFGNPSSIPAIRYGIDKRMRAMWCRACVMQVGISEPALPQDKQVAPESPLSFEEKLCALLEELNFTRGE